MLSTRVAGAPRVPCQCPAGFLRRGTALRGVHYNVSPGTTNQTNGRKETPEEAYQRRVRESREAEGRTDYVYSIGDFKEEMDRAGKNLVVLEVQSEVLCQTGIPDQDNLEYHYGTEAKAQHEAAMHRCEEVKHSFQRIARDCTDATFLNHMVAQDPDPESTELLEYLDIEVLPTVQFWREGRKLWEHRGTSKMESGIGEGVLFFDGSAAAGEKVTDFVGTIKNKRQFAEFVCLGDPNVLKVVNVATITAAPCIHVYPAVLALAKNFKGYAAFARMMGDASPELVSMMSVLNIKEVPTFLFFRNGKEVGRHVGSSRADLIGQILQLQNSLGIKPPPASPLAARRAPRRSNAVPAPRRNAWK